MDVAEATAGERDNDVLAAGAGVSMGTGSDRERASEKQKRWDALLKRPDLDYSDLFSEITGKLPGLSIWQIEHFYPVEIEEGMLYIVYIYMYVYHMYNVYVCVYMWA